MTDLDQLDMMRRAITALGLGQCAPEDLVAEAKASSSRREQNRAALSDANARIIALNRAFERIGAQPNVALTALDADVIKTYVSLGLGLGIIASMAYDPVRDQGLQARDVSQFFGLNTTRIGLRRGTYLRRFEYDFIELFASHLSKRAVDMAMEGSGLNDEYQL